MPINIEQLDSFDDNVTILLGRNILLKILEDQPSKLLLRNNLVEALISVKDLASDKLVKTVEELLSTDRPPPVLGMSFLLSDIRDHTVDFASASWDTLERIFLDAKASWKSWTPELEIPPKRPSTERLLERYSQALFSFSEAQRDVGVEQAWKGREKKLMELEEQVKKLTGLELLEPTVLTMCPHCMHELRMGEFKGNEKCLWCQKEVSRSDAKRLPIHQVAYPIRKLWEKDLWFEAYFAKLLRRLDWKTWVKVHIMGSSGVSHEIDVLAIKGSNIIVAECKTGKVSRNDVFNFLTKTQDLKVHLGLMALLRSLPDPETKEFVKRNRLLSLVEAITTATEDEVLDKMRQTLPA